MGKITYDKEFVGRTIDLLDSFYSRNVNYELNATMLYNCMLGLIVTAVENANRNKLLKDKVDKGLLSVLPEDLKILKRNKIHLQSFKKEEIKSRSKIDFLKLLRNGIAHQNIEAKNENGKWIGVKIWNINRANKKNFEIELSNDEAYTLAKYIAQHYIKKSNKK
jgi:hypothetical protein